MTLSLTAGIAQLFVFGVMAVLLPKIMVPTGWGMARYTIYSGIIWIAYTMMAMLVDIVLKTDVPGIGYLVMGFIAWIIGFIILIHRRRVSREQSAKAVEGSSA